MRFLFVFFPISIIALSFIPQHVAVGLADHVFDWCTGGEAIAWVDPAKEAVTEKIAAGAKLAPIRGEDGKIEDLKAFVNDRLIAVPQDALMESLPTLIIENECATVVEATDNCEFDSAGTPAPHNFGIEEGLGDFSFWEVEKSFTVVYVPAPNTGEDESELTNTKKKKNLASLKVRGNSSRADPKKQFQIKFKDDLALIPNTPPAKKWILSAKLASWQPDKTYVGNPAVFSSYRRYGELQKKFSESWPKEGSIEDFASRAWSPNTLPVNFVFQGRFVGVYNIMEKVEVLENGGRVWIPDEATNLEFNEIEGLKIPQGNYFLEQDAKHAAGVEYFEQGFQFPTHPDWIANNYPNFWPPQFHDLPYMSIPVFSIGYPDDETFLEYNQDSENEDVSALRSLINQIMKWAEDPVGNDYLLAQFIDMKSMARWYLTEEITREGDAYVVSQKWKFVKGKLYHASLWDFGGNSFMMTCDSDHKPGNTQYIDYDTNLIGDFPCDNSTGYFYSTGWHVDSVYYISCLFKEGYTCHKDDGSTFWDMRRFYRHLFRAPSLQKEFWSLFDLVETHGLVDDADNENMEADTDIFNFGGLIDEYFQKVQKSAEVDLKIWSVPIVIINMLGASEFPVVDEDTCRAILYEYLLSSGVSDGSGNITSIPAREWSFEQVADNSKFFDFFEAAAKSMPPAAEYVDGVNWPAYTSDEAVKSAKDFIKVRLEWIASQRNNYEDAHVMQHKGPNLKAQEKTYKA